MSNVSRAARKAENSDTFDHAVRIGLVAYGVVHLMIGWLALQVAFGEKSKSASSTGAMHALANQPLGAFLVWAVAIGLIVLVLWRAVEAWQAWRDEDGADRVKGLASPLLKGALYLTLAVSATKTALGDSAGGSGTDTMTAQVMRMTAGPLLVGAAGLAVLGYGAYYVYQGWTEKFWEKIHGAPGSSEMTSAYRWSGKAGYIAKGVAIGVIGGLFVYAALTHDAQKSGGLDQALQAIAEQPFGQLLLTLVAAGIALYGVFAFARARHFSS